MACLLSSKSTGTPSAMAIGAANLLQSVCLSAAADLAHLHSPAQPPCALVVDWLRAPTACLASAVQLLNEDNLNVDMEINLIVSDIDSVPVPSTAHLARTSPATVSLARRARLLLALHRPRLWPAGSISAAASLAPSRASDDKWTPPPHRKAFSRGFAPVSQESRAKHRWVLWSGCRLECAL